MLIGIKQRNSNGQMFNENIMANKTSENVATTTDSNSNFQWSDDLVEDLLQPLSNFETMVEFQNND